MVVRAGEPPAQDLSGGESHAGLRPGPARPTASVVTVGFCAESFVPGQAKVAAFGQDPTADDVVHLIDAVSVGLEEAGHVVAIYPKWAAEPALQRLETTSAALGTTGLATYSTDLPPLAGAVLASLASATARHVESAGALVAGLPTLEAELLVYAWMKSVAKLSRPAPTLMQHLVSMWPSTSFGVCLQPDPLVQRLSAAGRSIPIPTTYRPMCLAVSVHPGGDETWASEVVAPGLGAPPIKTLPPIANAASWWGTGRLVEAVAYPIDVPVVARRITQHLNTSLCRWCGEAIASDACPFCGLNRSAPKSRSGS